MVNSVIHIKMNLNKENNKTCRKTQNLRKSCNARRHGQSQRATS
nr:MAG TPA: hypothetical protein [Caudoviricetes sp.]